MADTTRHGRRRKQRRRNVISLILIAAAIVILIFALWRLIPILLDYRQSNNTYEDLAGEIVDFGPDRLDTMTDEYDWAGVTIDFDALWAINPDVVAWIRFDDTTATNVDYPILYDTDNNTYLRHDLYGQSHVAGSIFLEAQNNPDFSDLYNIVYGHNMRNGSMFGTLKKFRDEEGFYEENRYFTIYTPDGAYRYEVFGYADVRDDDDIYQVGFAPDEEYQELINHMLSTSYLDTSLVPAVDQQIATLSTCTAVGDRYRFVVYGVCIAEDHPADHEN